MFVLQIAVSKTEIQDVAVIMVDKDKNKKITFKSLETKNSTVRIMLLSQTSPPPLRQIRHIRVRTCYRHPPQQLCSSIGTHCTVCIFTCLCTYYPPYYYGYYPLILQWQQLLPLVFIVTIIIITMGILRRDYGGGNTVIINNRNNYVNHYNNNRNTSNRVQHNNANGITEETGVRLNTTFRWWSFCVNTSCRWWTFRWWPFCIDTPFQWWPFCINTPVRIRLFFENEFLSGGRSCRQ